MVTKVATTANVATMMWMINRGPGAAAFAYDDDVDEVGDAVYEHNGEDDDDDDGTANDDGDDDKHDDDDDDIEVDVDDVDRIRDFPTNVSACAY